MLTEEKEKQELSPGGLGVVGGASSVIAGALTIRLVLTPSTYGYFGFGFTSQNV